MSSESTPLLTAEESIRLEGVSKRYRLGTWGVWGGDLRDDVRRLLARALGRHDVEALPNPRVDALADVSLSIKRGENVGLIGSNGAGKSTLLKLIARITRPSRGALWVRGRVAALIQLGAGFHRELTGRENVYLYGAILGLNRSEIRARYDDIVAFAGLERFMETPVKRFSNGMYVRLGFSVAVHVAPDVLLIDEVLAVGDQAFREKCLERMRAYMEGETTLVFVSHDRELIESVCDRAILLDAGQVMADGPVSQVLDIYEARALESGQAIPDRARFGAAEPPAIEVIGVELRDAQGRIRTSFGEGQPLRVGIAFAVHSDVEALVISVRIHRGMTLVFASSTAEQADHRPFSAGSRGRAELALEALSLLGGQYAVSVTAEVVRGRRTARSDVLERVLHFRVNAPAARGTGLVSLGPSWHLDGEADLGEMDAARVRPGTPGRSD